MTGRLRKHLPVQHLSSELRVEVIEVMSNFLDLGFIASNRKTKVDSVANVALEHKPA